MKYYEKKDFEEEARLKELAILYFHEHFRRDLEIKNYFKSEALEAQYMNYQKKKYANGEYYSKRSTIEEAYNYLKQMVRDKKSFIPKTSVVSEVLQSYEHLIIMISEYRFGSSKNPSASQTKANKEILFEISLFKPMIKNILRNIDNHLLNVKNSNEVDDFICGVINELKKLNNNLVDSRKSLSSASDSYKDTKDWVLSRKKQLGKDRKQWRLEKNESCHSVLNFIRELEELNIAVYYGTFKYKDENHGLDKNTVKISNTFDNCVEKIRNSPNYFCYITEQEKQELKQEKVLRKLHSDYLSSKSPTF